MHPNNIFSSPYKFDNLIQVHPALKSFIIENKLGQDSINFADPDAVFHLNAALLISNGLITEYNLPPGYLSPAVPSRADYLYHLKDLMEEVPLENQIKGLDIGTGANAIYCILGATLFGWNMVGSDIDETAVNAARKHSEKLSLNKEYFEIRHQPNNANIFEGIIKVGEFFHFTVCNPPFYSSKEEAQRAAIRKLKNLYPEKSILELERNFQGMPNELYCNGGEALFIKRMIKQSVQFKDQVGWFTTLVSNNDNLPKILKILKRNMATHRILQMEFGNKISRAIAWRF